MIVTFEEFPVEGFPVEDLIEDMVLDGRDLVDEVEFLESIEDEAEELYEFLQSLAV
jgi:hypothetical protein